MRLIGYRIDVFPLTINRRNPQRQQEELAPMPSFDTSPPRAAERPALPQRQTAAMTKAQPDDLADVKKVS
jgi:hypothetical protein